MSPLIFRHIVFHEKPCIPAMILIHERKLSETHQDMFRECVRCIPALKKSKCPLVTDREQGIVDAAQKVLPSISLVHWWNHIYRDIRLWLKKHGAPSSDMAVYCDDVSRLLQSHQEEDYQALLAQL